MTLTGTLSLLLLATVCTTTQGGVFSERDRLYHDIFTNYSSKTLPVLNPAQQVVIKASTQMSSINNFNELTGELSVTASLFLEWTEERISWTPSDYSGITSISVSPVDLWRPQMFLLESTESVTDLANTSIQPILYDNGKVMWYSANVLKVACSVDVEFFPYDKQKCELTLLSWDMFSADVIYFPNSSVIQTTYFKANSQWEFAAGTLQNCTLPLVPCLNMFITLTRRSSFYVIYIIIPLIFLSLINSLVFLMPPSSGERTSVAVTAFLSFVVYMDIVNNLVPQSSDPVAYIYYYIMFLMVYSCCIMFLCIISLRIYDRQTDVPRWLQTMVRVMLLKFPITRSSKVGDIADVREKEQPNSAGAHGEGQGYNKEEPTKDPKKDPMVHDDAGSSSGTEEPSRTNGSDVTWYTVGKTFDMYCCVLLYVFVIVFTSFIYVKITTGTT